MKKNIAAALCAPSGEFSAYVGIDWADKSHVWRLQEAGSCMQEHGTLEHSPETVESWVAQLRTRFPEGKIAICLEQSRGPLVYALVKYDHVVLFPVHPTTSARYRESFAPAGAKDDTRDAACLLDLLLRHPDRLEKLNPDTVETRQIQILSQHRRELVDQRTACSNRMRAILKLYYPQILRWFDDIASPTATAVLQRWPTIGELKRSKPSTIRRFLQTHGCQDCKRVDSLLADLPTAVAATTDAAVVSTSRRAIAVLVDQVELLRSAIHGYDEEIEKLAQDHPDYAIVQSFPGVGPALGPRLIAALGTQRDRFHSARDLQCFTGIAPVTEQSGESKWVHVRRACPQFVRQTLHEWASCSRMKCQWAEDFYQSQRQAGKRHHAAIRSLAFKWLRILFRCWKDRTPYVEAQYKRAQPASCS